MGPSRRFRSSAITFFAVASVLWAAPGFAQYSTFADAALEAAGLSVGPLTRSPALIGMGQLTLVGTDPHYRLNLWDFALNPTGVGSADSASTLELRPGGSGASDVQSLAGSPLTRVQQAFAARGTDMGFEAWHREGTLTYGAIGHVGSLQYDQPYSDGAERRVRVSSPWVMPVISGVMPYTKSGRSRYALRMHWSGENQDTRYLADVQNAAGQFISMDSEELRPPNIFKPESFLVHQFGVGIGVSHSFGAWSTMAIGFDHVTAAIQGNNDQKRSGAQTHESRPYNIVQFSEVGRFGPSFEWGVDGRVWKSNSQSDWDFSISGGQGTNPLTGRGKLLEREEVGQRVHSRAVLHIGAIDIGAGVQTDAQRADITPPAIDDLTSLNYFINTTYYRRGADSLALPDSVQRDRSQLRAWAAGGGLALRLPRHRGQVGLEYHRSRRIGQSWLGGLGPKREDWDVRGGMEYRCTPVLSGRIGYQFARTDRDVFIVGNKYQSQLMTLGLGVSPVSSSWKFDLSYGLRWLQADFGNPGEPRGSRQQLASQIHWTF